MLNSLMPKAPKTAAVAAAITLNRTFNPSAGFFPGMPPSVVPTACEAPWVDIDEETPTEDTVLTDR